LNWNEDNPSYLVLIMPFALLTQNWQDIFKYTFGLTYSVFRDLL